MSLKKSLKLGLRFQTNKGMLSTEQLFQLSLSDLSDAVKTAKSALKEVDNDDELAFLEEKTKVDSIEQLRFDVLKEVYLDKKDELTEAKEAGLKKAHNAKIDALIAEKKEGQLKEMSIDELEKLRK